MPTLKQNAALPFRITAKRTQNIVETNSILYTGDVVAFGEEVRIRAESLLVTMSDDDVPIEMVARDEVMVTRGKDEIYGNKAVWSPDQKTLVLTGETKMKDIGDWILGDEITLHLDTGKIEIKGRRMQPAD